jgi:DNA polymerase-3 subunit epsilon
MSNKEYAIIDIETTGGSAHREKITEIAIVVYDGQKIVEQYETLINPERSIPHFITRLTGIDNDMVKDAPKFYEVARDIVELTENRIFVAHNVRFDYGFIQEEFRRLGYTFSRKQLCTVRLSRKAFPGLRSYSLGNLIKHFRIEVKDRHRAMADVLATVEVFKQVLTVNGGVKGSDTLFKSSLKNILLPERLGMETIMELPEATGVYYFLDADDKIIYVGKSINIRKRIRQHFQNINPKSNKLYQRSVRIDFELTGSELIACLLETEAIKKHQPEINRASRQNHYEYFIHHFLNTSGYHEFGIEKNNPSNRKNKQILTVHHSLQSAKTHLRRLQREYMLCEKLLGLEFGSGPCFQYGIGQCNGACMESELPADYNKRAAMAVGQMDRIDPGNLLLIDRGRQTGERSYILVKNGQFHGFSYQDLDFTLSDQEQLTDHIPRMTYYPEQNTIIKRFLESSHGLQVIKLS